MDHLHRKVSALVEFTEQSKADSVETFLHVKALALAELGQDFSVSRAVQDYGHRKILPHLTETWFC